MKKNKRKHYGKFRIYREVTRVWSCGLGTIGGTVYNTLFTCPFNFQGVI